MNDKLVERVAVALWLDDAERAAPKVAKYRTSENVLEQSGIKIRAWRLQAKAAIEAAGVVELAEHLRFALNALQTEGVCGDECLTCPEARTAIAKALGDE